MAITSNKPYVRRRDVDTKLADVKKVLASLLQLDISLQMKKRMVGYVIWEITTYLHGNFKGRYRSTGSMVLGAKVERDHVNQKARIIERLVTSPEQMDTILDDIVHCVVTKEEHERLTAYSKTNPNVDGWDRYRNVGIEVMDMLKEERFI